MCLSLEFGTLLKFFLCNFCSMKQWQYVSVGNRDITSESNVHVAVFEPSVCFIPLWNFYLLFLFREALAVCQCQPQTQSHRRCNRTSESSVHVAVFEHPKKILCHLCLVKQWWCVSVSLINNLIDRVTTSDSLMWLRLSFAFEVVSSCPINTAAFDFFFTFFAGVNRCQSVSVRLWNNL